MNECRLVSDYSFMPQGSTGDSYKEASLGLIQKRQTETRLILMRKKLNRENPSRVGRERKQPSSTRMYLSGEMAGKDRHFLLKGLALHGEIRHTHIC